MDNVQTSIIGYNSQSVLPYSTKKNHETVINLELEHNSTVISICKALTIAVSCEPHQVATATIHGNQPNIECRFDG